MVTPRPMHSNPSPLQTSGGLSQKCKDGESSRCIRVKGRHHQANELRGCQCHLQAMQEEDSCQPPVHPRAPQTILLCARLIPITKKDGGNKAHCHRDHLPQAHQLCHHVQPQGEAPWHILPCAVWCWHARRCLEHSTWNQKPLE